MYNDSLKIKYDTQWFTIGIADRIYQIDLDYSIHGVVVVLVLAAQKVKGGWWATKIHRRICRHFNKNPSTGPTSMLYTVMCLKNYITIIYF